MAAKKDNIGEVKATDLEKMLGRTVINKFYNSVDKFYLGNLNKSGGEFIVPVLEGIVEGNDNLRSQLIKVYDGYLGMHKLVNEIPEFVKLSQGALLDGLAFCYDVTDGSYALYTMNTHLLMQMGVDVEFVADKVMDKNKVAELKAYRVDVEYKNGESRFQFKVVNHRKKLDLDTIVVIPYIFVVRGMFIIQSILKSGYVLKIVQDFDGLMKERVITLSQNILKMFCDDESAIEFAKPAYFPLKAMLYAPVVGAPSTTAMVTKVELFKLDGFTYLKSKSDLRKMGIVKPENPVKILVCEHLAESKLEELKREDPDRLNRLLMSPEFVDFPVESAEDYSASKFSSYLHQLSSERSKQVYSAIPGMDIGVEKYKFLMGESESVEVPKSGFTKEQLSDLLKKGIFKVLLRKDDCMLSSVLCTNNERVLEDIYGSDYKMFYESYGYNDRISYAAEKISRGMNPVTVLSEYKLRCDKDVLSALESVGNNDFPEDIEEVLNKVYKVFSRKSSSESNAVLVRLCFAKLGSDGKAKEYYRSIDPSKVIKIDRIKK